MKLQVMLVSVHLYGYFFKKLNHQFNLVFRQVIWVSIESRRTVIDEAFNLATQSFN